MGALTLLLREEKSSSMNSSLLLLGVVCFVASFPQDKTSGQSSEVSAGVDRSVTNAMELTFYKPVPENRKTIIWDNILEEINEYGTEFTFCKAASGAYCKFPFVWEGAKYTHCIYYGNDGHTWCATEADSNGQIIDGKWENCDFCWRNPYC